MVEQKYDDLNIWCAQEGLDVPFRYCRTVAKGLPCERILDCWQDRFSIGDYIRDHYTPEEMMMIFGDTRLGMKDIPDLPGRKRRIGPDEHLKM